MEYSMGGKGENRGETSGLTWVDIADPLAAPWVFAVCWEPPWRRRLIPHRRYRANRYRILDTAVATVRKGIQIYILLGYVLCSSDIQ